MNKGKTWVDLSDIVVWRGYHTGIQRLVFQIASRYAKKDNVGFFVYDDQAEAFLEVDFNKVPGIRQDDLIEPAEQTNTRSRMSVGQLARMAASRSLNSAKAVFYMIPLEARKKIPTSVRRTPKIIFHNYKKLREEIKKKPVGHLPEEFALLPPVVFNTGDTILVLGAGWAKKDFQIALAKLRTTQGVKVYQVVYDLIPIVCPQLFGPGFFELFAEYYFDAVNASDGFIAISQTTKKDLEYFIDDLLLPRKEIVTFRLGDDVSLSESIEPRNLGLTPGKYILCVGTLEVRKNHQLIYQAYKMAKLNGFVLPQMVIVGQPGWLSKDLLYQLEKDPDVRDRITIVKGIDDNRLRWLYENCSFTVYPSLYEGWGLPIAESLNYGKLCLASNTSSMTEIAGDKIDYFSPYNSHELYELLVKYSQADELEKANSRIKEYTSVSWDESMVDFEKVLDQLH